MSKFLVTGGAGFIGSEICHLLIKMQHEVIAFDNLSSGHFENIADLVGHPGFTFVKGDVRNQEEITKAAIGVQYIMHQAALVSVPRSIEEPYLNHEINISGFVCVLEAARINQVKRVVYASSSAVYGDNQDEIKQEKRIGTVISPYALSKLTDEMYASLYFRLYGIETVGLRYFNVYGEKQDPSSVYSGVISIFFKKVKNQEDIIIYGDGSITRDFIHVTDVASANVLAATSKNNVSGKVYNIGTNQSTSIRQLAEIVLQATNKKTNIVHAQARKGDILFSCANVTKATKDLGFRAQISLLDGLTAMASKM